MSIDLLALRSSHAAILLAATTRIVVASGIANSQDARRGVPRTLRSPPGGEHAPSVAVRGGTYSRPVETMRAYLDAMAAAQSSRPRAVPLVADDGGGSFATSGSAPSILCFDVAATAGVAGSAT